MPYPKQQIQIDLSGRRGLGDKFYGDINNFGFTGDLSSGQPNYRVNVKDANQEKDGQMASGIFNPLRKYGYLSPAVGTIYPINSALSGLTMMSANRFDSTDGHIGDKYFMAGVPSSGVPKIWKVTDIDGETFNVDRSMPAGSTVGGSLEIYTVNDVRNLFYSYKYSSGWRIGVKDLTSGTYTDNWFGTSGSATGAYQMDSTGECKFILGGDGYMYVLQANHVNRIDGTSLGGSTGTITKDVLLAPSYFRFTHGVDFNGNLYLALQKNTASEIHIDASYLDGSNLVSDCGVFVWNRQSNFNGTSYIPIQGIREIRALWISPKNDIRCITIAANGVVQIRIYDGNVFKVVKELGAWSYPNYSDSLCVIGGFTVWFGFDGNLYYHGSEGVDINVTNYGAVQNEKEFLFIMGSVGGLGIPDVQGGTILYCGGNFYATGGTEKPHPEAFHIMYEVTGVAKNAKFFPFSNGSITGGVTTAVVANVTPIFTPIKMLPTLSTLKHITIMMAREQGLSAGVDDADIKIYINGSTTVLMTKTITTDDIMKGYKAIEINTPFVDSIQLSITYKPIAMSNKRFNPSYAVVDFVPNETIK